MSALDLTEAVTTADGHTLVAAEAAALVAINRRLEWASLHWGTERVSPDAWPHIAIAAAAAVAPLIERQVRERIAAEIEAAPSAPFMETHDTVSARCDALNEAARIARGGAA